MLRIILTAFTIVDLQTNLCPTAKRPAPNTEEDDALPASRRPIPAAAPRLMVRWRIKHAIASAQITHQQREMANTVLRCLQRDHATEEVMTETIEALLAGFS